MSTSRWGSRGNLMAGAAALAAWTAAAAPNVARAQDGPAPPLPAATAPATAAPVVPAMDFDRLTLRDVVARVAKAQPGARVFVDRGIGGAVVTLRTEAGPLPQVLAQIAAAAQPAGAQVRTTLLPATPAGAPPLDADTVADYVRTEDALRERLRPAGAGAAAGTGGGDAVVMGRALRGEEARAVVAALNLEPAFLLVNPAAAGDPVTKMTRAQEEALGVFMMMTPEQREAVAERQFESLMNMDPSARRALLQQQGQMMQKFMTKVQQMAPEQRRSFLSDLTGGRWDGTTPPPRAPQGGGANGSGGPGG